jgi:hypothetical protein
MGVVWSNSLAIRAPAEHFQTIDFAWSRALRADRAPILATGLRAIDGLNVRVLHHHDSSMCRADDVAALGARLRDAGVVATVGINTHFVTHLDIDRAMVERVIATVLAFYAGR